MPSFQLLIIAMDKSHWSNLILSTQTIYFNWTPMSPERIQPSQSNIKTTVMSKSSLTTITLIYGIPHSPITFPLNQLLDSLNTCYSIINNVSVKTQTIPPTELHLSGLVSKVIQSGAVRSSCSLLSFLLSTLLFLISFGLLIITDNTAATANSSIRNSPKLLDWEELHRHYLQMTEEG